MWRAVNASPLPAGGAVARVLHSGVRRLRSALRSPAIWAAATIFSLLSGYLFSTLLTYYVRRATFADRQIQIIGRSDLQLDVPTVLLNEFFKYEGFILLFVAPLVAMALTRQGGSGASGTGARRAEDGGSHRASEPGEVEPPRGNSSPVTRRAEAWNATSTGLDGTLLAAVSLLAGMLLLTLPLFGFVAPIGLGEPGVVAAGYLGLLLLGSAQLSIGLFVSSMFDSAGWAVVTTGASLAALSFADGAAWAAGSPWRELSGVISIQVHYADFTRGLIAGSEVGYFGTWIVLGWVATRSAPSASRALGASGALRRSRTALALACVAATAVLAWFEPVRIDATTGHRNTLPPDMRSLVASAGGVRLIQFGPTRDPRLDWMAATIAAAGGHIRRGFVDNVRHPDVAARYGVVRDGTVVVEFGSQRRSLENPTFGKIAAAVAELTGVQHPIPAPDPHYPDRRISAKPHTELVLRIAAMLFLPLLPLVGWLRVAAGRPRRSSGPE